MHLTQRFSLVVGSIVVATIAVLVALVALVGAALASPYLLVRSVRRRLRPATNTTYPFAERDAAADRPPDRLRVVGGPPVAAFAHYEPDEAPAILEDATRDAA